jgi:hypothetical protein
VGDLLKSGSAWLQATRKASLASGVSYARASVGSVNLLATNAKKVYEVDAGDGSVISIESHDYLITVADLLINSIPIFPKPGDQITDANMSGTPAVFEVMDLSRAKPCYEYSDDWRQTFRIHTKFVGLAE